MWADAAGSGPSLVAVIRCETQGVVTMHVERGGGRFVASVLLLAVAGNDNLAQEHKEHKTYRCKVADVVRLDDNGRLHSDSNPKDILRQRFDGVIIDTLTGAVTYPGGDREVWNVVQRGNSGNDQVALLPARPHRAFLQTASRPPSASGLGGKHPRCSFWRLI